MKKFSETQNYINITKLIILEKLKLIFALIKIVQFFVQCRFSIQMLLLQLVLLVRHKKDFDTKTIPDFYNR